MPGILLLLALGACCLPSMGASQEEAAPAKKERSSKLRSSSDFRGGCFDDFSPTHHADVATFLREGRPAVDFTLRDRNGKKVQLAELLEKKPVVLHTGSYTCDRYQARRRGINSFAQEFEDDVYTVVVYTLEAHPEEDPSPYRGRTWERKFSDRHQQSTYTQRLLSASDLGVKKPVIALVDEMDNPFWCTYGTCPNCAFLVAQDGTIEAVHKWYDPQTMAESTRALLNR